MKGLVKKLVLPEVPEVQLCFAYGSGVFSQQQQRDATAMIDLVFVVENSRRWHSENLKRRSSDYPGYLRSGRVASALQRWGSGNMFFLPYARFPGNGEVGDSSIFKYGVIELADFIRDLTSWESLYVAGRLHKPVLMVTEPSAPVTDALTQNLRSALAGGLLICEGGAPQRQFSDTDLFHSIGGISYAGDVRMKFAENPKKVDNIVNNNLEAFRGLYSPLLAEFKEQGLINLENETISVKSGQGLRNLLPIPLESLPDVVGKSSSTQTIKGAISAGVWNSMRYAGRKILKRLQ